MASSENEVVKLSKLASYVTEIVRRDATSAQLRTKILKFDINFEDKYDEKVVATRVVHIVKDMIGLIILNRIRAQSHYRYI